jgi:hypothetical protein
LAGVDCLESQGTPPAKGQAALIQGHAAHRFFQEAASHRQSDQRAAGERIAKEINKSERYVWKALALLENPTKLLESED